MSSYHMLCMSSLPSNLSLEFDKLFAAGIRYSLHLDVVQKSFLVKKLKPAHAHPNPNFTLCCPRPKLESHGTKMRS